MSKKSVYYHQTNQLAKVVEAANHAAADKLTADTDIWARVNEEAKELHHGFTTHGMKEKAAAILTTQALHKVFQTFPKDIKKSRHKNLWGHGSYLDLKLESLKTSLNAPEQNTDYQKYLKNGTFNTKEIDSYLEEYTATAVVTILKDEKSKRRAVFRTRTEELAEQIKVRQQLDELNKGYQQYGFTEEAAHREAVQTLLSARPQKVTVYEDASPITLSDNLAQKLTDLKREVKKNQKFAQKIENENKTTRQSQTNTKTSKNTVAIAQTTTALGMLGAAYFLNDSKKPVQNTQSQSQNPQQGQPKKQSWFRKNVKWFLGIPAVALLGEVAYTAFIDKNYRPVLGKFTDWAVNSGNSTSKGQSAGKF